MRILTGVLGAIALLTSAAQVAKADEGCDRPAPSAPSNSSSTMVSIIPRIRSRISASMVSGPHANPSSSTAFLLSLSMGVIFLYSPASECESFGELAR